MTTTVFSHKLHPGYSVRPKVWLSALLTAVLVGVYLWLASMLVQVSIPESIAVAAPVSATPTAQTTPVATTATVATVPTCTPTPALTMRPVSLTSTPTGLTKLTDPATQYRIYGNTASELRDQIRRCAPGSEGHGGAEYTATTTYTMSWQYDTRMLDGGTCQVTNAKVGVRIRMTLPHWEPTASANSGLATEWQDFMGALTTHETGHATLDAQYAAQLTADLNNLPVMDCGSLALAAQRVANTDIAALNQANNNYDSSTNHGATQGAILPQ